MVGHAGRVFSGPYFESLALIDSFGAQIIQPVAALSWQIANWENMKQDKSLHWWSSPQKLLRAILMLDDNSHSIALGTTIGMFIGMTPTVGIQMILVVVFAFLVKPILKFNRMAALITVYISNPLTVLPIYWFDYKVGSLLIPGDVSREDFAKILHYQGFEGWWNTFAKLFLDVGAPLVVGSFIVATISSIATYPMLRWLLRSHDGQFPPDHELEQKPVATAAK